METQTEQKLYFLVGFREERWEIVHGTIITTNNMWCQGILPQRLREQYPDNAKFL